MAIRRFASRFGALFGAALTVATCFAARGNGATGGAAAAESGDAIRMPRATPWSMEWRRGADADHADADFRATTFQQAQPQSNHNGGMLAFGSDGVLYLGLGDRDGGGSDDQHPPPFFGSDLAGEVYVVDIAGTVFRVEAAPS